MPEEVDEGPAKWELMVVLLLLFIKFELTEVFEEVVVVDESVAGWKIGSTFSLNKVICTKWGMCI